MNFTMTIYVQDVIYKEREKCPIRAKTHEVNTKVVYGVTSSCSALTMTMTRKKIMIILTNIKNELSELRVLVKFIEKDNIVYMLLVGIIVVFGIVLVA